MEISKFLSVCKLFNCSSNLVTIRIKIKHLDEIVNEIGEQTESSIVDVDYSYVYLPSHNHRSFYFFLKFTFCLMLRISQNLRWLGRRLTPLGSLQYSLRPNVAGKGM